MAPSMPLDFDRIPGRASGPEMPLPARLGWGALCGLGAGLIGGALSGMAFGLAVTGFDEPRGLAAAAAAAAAAGLAAWLLLRRARVGPGAVAGIALVMVAAAYTAAVALIFPLSISGMGGIPMPATFGERFVFFLVVPAIGAIYGAVVGGATGLLSGLLLGAAQTRKRSAPLWAGALAGAAAGLAVYVTLTLALPFDVFRMSLPQALAVTLPLALCAALAGWMAQAWFLRRLRRGGGDAAP